MKKFFIPALLLFMSISVLLAQDAKTEKQAATISIVDAKLGKDVKDRAIVDEASTFELNAKVFLWLKVSGTTSDSILVMWRQGEFTRETRLFVGGNPWRTWAAKTAMKKGDWTVTVKDLAGNVLKELKFNVQ